MSEERRPSTIGLWLRYGSVWVVLVALLGITFATSYLHLGDKSPILHLGIAGIQVLLVWLLFMNLLGSSKLIRLCSMAGLLFLAFMFSLTFGDYLTRAWHGGPIGSCLGKASGEHGRDENAMSCASQVQGRGIGPEVRGGGS